MVARVPRSRHRRAPPTRDASEPSYNRASVDRSSSPSKIELACGGGTVGTCPGALDAGDDAAHCPSQLPFASTAPIAQDLSEQQNGQTTPDPISVLPPGCPATNKDCFADKNVMAIVVQVDKTYIATDEKKLLAVYGSTHAGQ